MYAREMNRLLQQLIDIGAVDNKGNMSKGTFNTIQQHPDIREQLLASTEFVNSTDFKLTLRERIYCIKHDIIIHPVCLVCNTLVSFRTSGIKVGYPENCSTSCVAQSKIRQSRRRDTNISVYGYPTAAESQTVKDKTLSTNHKKYGRQHCNQAHYSDSAYDIITSDKLSVLETSQSLLSISKTLNISNTSLGRHLSKGGYDLHQKYTSTGERELKLFLESHNLHGVYNSRKIIAPLELDIYLPEYKVAIEYCGLYWHSEQQGKDKHYHKNKLDACRVIGIRLITIFEDEWVNNKALVCSKLLNILYLSPAVPSVYARQTTIESVSTSDKKSFFSRYHIQGDGPGSITYGLKQNGVMVACLSFVKQPENKYVLNRYATSVSVVGGFSRLLSHFKKLHHWDQIITFADLRWSVGQLYIATGFVVDSYLAPDYCYSPTGHNRVHKFNYRRKYLPVLLQHFDSLLSERENCNRNNVLRVWDCGKIRFVLNREQITN